jgi:hypothetical protein
MEKTVILLVTLLLLGSSVDICQAQGNCYSCSTIGTSTPACAVPLNVTTAATTQCSNGYCYAVTGTGTYMGSSTSFAFRGCINSCSSTPNATSIPTTYGITGVSISTNNCCSSNLCNSFETVRANVFATSLLAALALFVYKLK